MLQEVFQNWFDGTVVQETPEYSISMSLGSRKKSRITGKETVSLRALVILNGGDINFIAMNNALVRSLELDDARIGRMYCSWIVLSARGGIYLYEALAQKEYIRCSGMRNRFLVINSEDGSFSFGPGHILNREYSETMQDLLSRMKNIPPALFLRKFSSIMESSLEDLER